MYYFHPLVGLLSVTKCLCQYVDDQKTLSQYTEWMYQSIHLQLHDTKKEHMGHIARLCNSE